MASNNKIVTMIIICLNVRFIEQHLEAEITPIDPMPMGASKVSSNQSTNPSGEKESEKPCFFGFIYRQKSCYAQEAWERGEDTEFHQSTCILFLQTHRP